MQTKVINVEVFDDELQERFSGQFTVKRLSIKDTNMIGTLRTQLNGNMHVGENGMGVDEATNGYNHMLATLQVALVTVPQGFSLEELYSLTYAAAIFKEVTMFNDSFRRGRKSSEVVQGQSSQSQTGSSTPAQGTSGLGNTTAVVPGEIQLTLDP